MNPSNGNAMIDESLNEKTASSTMGPTRMISTTATSAVASTALDAISGRDSPAGLDLLPRAAPHVGVVRLDLRDGVLDSGRVGGLPELLRNLGSGQSDW